MKLYKNSLYSAISMAANLLLPLAATPFLLRALENNAFGQLAIAQATTILIGQIIDYGFSLGAAREIATQNNPESVSQVYSHYQNARLLLLLIALAATPILLLSNAIAAPNHLLAATLIPFCIGTFLQSNWVFHGRAEYGWLAVANTLGKFIYLGIAIFAIDSSYDLVLAGLAFGCSQLVSGLILQVALIKMKFKFAINFSFKKNLSTIKKGTSNFVSIALLSVHTQLIIVLTGHFSSVKAAGDISIIDKAIRGLAAIMFPIANSSFSRLSQLHQLDTNAAATLHKKLSAGIIAFACLSTFIVLLFGEALAKRIFQMHTEFLGEMIISAAPMPIFIAIGLLYGGLKLIPMGFNREYLTSITIGELCGLLAFFLCLDFNKNIAGLIAISTAEFIIGAGMFFSAKLKETQR